ncbi:MAG TPA: polysaccharide deacetylase family protein [Rhodopila sp.]|uniref:polysaccharide deacetylase family protein n=1 Tax=Rhodopila sp. TaxID=2480087 RepID=UPI002B984742|nr:polysaccharide deacetylase family protein [Rhodopila sp.]HVY14529.1 polysaccharide deacetylase family protein [Rhodopila sp.]
MTAPAAMRRLAKATLRAAGEGVLHAVPTPVWRRLRPKTELGFCYHIVSHDNVAHLKHYPFLDPTEFETDLVYLRSRFDVISYPELVARRAAQTPVRDNAVVLTFDDGFAECASVIAPILRRHGVSGIFFIITDLVDNASLFRESEAALCIEAVCKMPVEQVETTLRDLDLETRLTSPPARGWMDPARTPLDIAGLDRRADPRLWPLLHWLLTIGPEDQDLMRRLSARLGVEAQVYLNDVRPYLTSQQIRQLQADGFTLGAHGRSHRWLGGLSPREAEREIVESCRIVADLTGESSVPFAFPYFGGGLDRRWLADLRRRHEVIGLFFDTDGLREDESFVVQRVFGERFGRDRTLDAILRRAWSRRSAWSAAAR